MCGHSFTPIAGIGPTYPVARMSELGEALHES